MNLNAIAGLPRSGSTLLCNILSQNPRFTVSGTSPLLKILGPMIKSWSDSVEVVSKLDRTEGAMTGKLVSILRAVCSSWYGGDEGFVWDKCRGWGERADLLYRINPNAKIVATIRHPLHVFASTELRYRETSELDSSGPLAHSMFKRADSTFNETGVIGSALISTMNLAYSNHPALYLRYEDLTEDPARYMDAVYEYLDETPFCHNFDNVESVSDDADAFYLLKYPHDGNGKVSTRDPDLWRKIISPDFAQQLMRIRPVADFCRVFGYEQNIEKLVQNQEMTEAR